MMPLCSALHARQTWARNKSPLITWTITFTIFTFITDAHCRNSLDNIKPVKYEQGLQTKYEPSCYLDFFFFPLLDDAFINPQLSKIFDRVRQSADFMPIKQMMVHAVWAPHPLQLHHRILFMHLYNMAISVSHRYAVLLYCIILYCK